MSALVVPGLVLSLAMIHSPPPSPATPGASLRKLQFFIVQVQMGKINQ